MSSHIDESPVRKRKTVMAEEKKEVEKETKTEKVGENIVERYVNSRFTNLSPRARTFIVRTIITLILLVTLPLMIFGGMAADFVIIYIIVLQCYREYIRVGYTQHMHHSLPLVRSLGWYIFFTGIYCNHGDIVITYFSPLLGKETYMFLTTYHNFISFNIFMLGIVIFVLSLKKHYYKMQFNLYAWFMIGSLFLSASSSFFFKNMTQGMIWAFVPVGLIVINDIFAYICGYMFGKTPLIKLSPKKTWEGFIGSGIITVILSLVLCKIMTTIPYFYCPYKAVMGAHTYDVTCKIPSYMEYHSYEFPLCIKLMLLNQFTRIEYMPIYIHMIVIGVFVSLVAPFGGFLASGFKRAFDIKDFGDTFPGHGGMLDRTDCQFLLLVFVHVYIITFVKIGQPHKMFQSILKFKPEDQLELFELLKNSLLEQGLIQLA